MKTVIKNYTFSASARTITLTDFTTVLLERLQLIVDVTTNAILYNFADSTVATAATATNVITLSTVGSAASSDKLQIIYDVSTGDPTYDVQPVAGGIASGAADSGNPVKTGGVYNANGLSLSAGQRGDIQITSRGYLKATLFQDGTNNNMGFTTSNADGNGQDGSAVLLKVSNIPLIYNGANFDRLRTPSTFKTMTATASGSTAVWTPASGKKFRLMRYMLTLTANVSCASAGIEEITFQDATTGLPIGFSVFVPAAAITTTPGGFTTGWIDMGNGILSNSANNTLNINLGTTLTTGECRIMVAGTEE